MNREIRGEDGGQTERFWEQHYRRRERVWSGRPNPVLVDVAGPLEPGTALDLGCGEGGDAVWLALRGWLVTAADVSTTALGRASARSVEDGVADRIRFQRHDLASTFPEGEFDLVSAQYLQAPIAFSRERILRVAAEAVAPGGMLLIVDHAWVKPDTRNPTAEEVLAAMDLPETWRVERLGSYEREATSGHAHAVTDNVIAIRKPAS